MPSFFVVTVVVVVIVVVDRTNPPITLSKLICSCNSAQIPLQTLWVDHHKCVVLQMGVALTLISALVISFLFSFHVHDTLVVRDQKTSARLSRYGSSRVGYLES